MLATWSLALAQPFQWPAEYAPSAPRGGMISEFIFGDVATLNPVLSASATEMALIGLYSGPSLLYRDWVGTRAFRNADGEFNLFWAQHVEELVFEQDFIVTLRQGWRWSDGVEMTADDFVAAHIITGDPEVEANAFSCAWVDDERVVVEKLGTYQFRLTLPRPQVNALAAKDCGAVPAHIFMPVYEAQGAAGIKALWGIDADLTTIVSGGPFKIVEFRAGERIAFERNPYFGEFVKAADGSPLPGPDSWVVTMVENADQILAATITGQTSFWWPTSLDHVRAVSEAVNAGTIGGTFYPNVGPGTLVDFATFNFNHTDPCKQAMFRAPAFRQAFAIMIDREVLVHAAVGGLGFPAIDYRSAAVAPFISDNSPFEVNPEEGLRLLRSIGFTEKGADGVLRNPQTGCRAEFDLQFNTGNVRRAQLALVISQQLDPHGVRVNPREVSTDIWRDSIVGTTLPRTVDYDAQIWGLAGGDVDNPGFINGLRRAANLNAWNKSTTDVEPWELLMERIDVQMYDALELGERIALWKRQAALLREYLPMVPLINTSFHLYHNLGNIWPIEAISATSAESPYRPGNFRQNLIAP